MIPNSKDINKTGATTTQLCLSETSPQQQLIMDFENGVIVKIISLRSIPFCWDALGPPPN